MEGSEIHTSRVKSTRRLTAQAIHVVSMANLRKNVAGTCKRFWNEE